jgi:tRNA nucleotidyltransferase (CCA-adding enzyme)
MMTVPGSVRTMARRYREAGHSLYIVGGAVRDSLLHKKVSDFDFATSAPPEVSSALFHRTIPTGIEHGTVTVVFRGSTYEITTFRRDGTYQDHRRPESVTFTDSLTEDLQRRDLTINAMAIDPLNGTLYDPFGGQRDLKEGVIRTVGDPEARFREDALRMVRAIRFATTLEFSMDTETSAAIARQAPTIDHIAKERIRQELEKMMTARRPSTGWTQLRSLGLLARFLPELLEDTLPAYRKRKGPAVFEHLLASCDCADPEDSGIRWSALFHDIGKPRTFSDTGGEIHFPSHESVSADMAVEIMERLRFSNQMIQSVSHLIRHHMFGYSRDWSDGAVRRFIHRVGVEHIAALVRLRRVDICGKIGSPPSLPDLDHMEGRIIRILKDDPPLKTTDLAVNGRDIMKRLGIPPGPVLGEILRELLQTVLDDPEMNDPDGLLDIAERFYRSRINLSDG